METAAAKQSIEILTVAERILALEERLRRQKKLSNEIIAFANALEARLEKLEK